MSPPKLIFNAFASQLGAAAKAAAVTSKDFAKRDATIKKLAAHIGVPVEHARALVNGDSAKLANATPAHLSSLANYLKGAAEKHLKKDKGNGADLKEWGTTLKEAYTLFRGRLAAADQKHHANVQNNTYERAIFNAKKGGEAAKLAAFPDVPGGKGIGAKAQAVHDHRRKVAEAAVRKLKAEAKTPKEKDAARLAASEVESLLRG